MLDYQVGPKSCHECPHHRGAKPDVPGKGKQAGTDRNRGEPIGAAGCTGLLPCGRRTITPGSAPWDT